MLLGSSVATISEDTEKDLSNSKQSINVNTNEECINSINCNGVQFEISNNNKEKEHAFGLSMNAATTNYSFITKNAKMAKTSNRGQTNRHSMNENEDTISNNKTYDKITKNFISKFLISSSNSDKHSSIESIAPGKSDKKYILRSKPFKYKTSKFKLFKTYD